MQANNEIEMKSKLPEFTAEDFTFTSEPFEYLYNIKDPFQQEQRRKQLDTMAKTLGVTGFSTLWRNYLKSKGEKAIVESENSTEFQNLEEGMKQLSCGKFRADEYGISVFEGDKFFQITPQPLTITRRFRNIESNELKVELAFRRSGATTWHKLIVDRDYIFNARKIVELSKNGLSVTTRHAPYVVEYLATLDALNDSDYISNHKSITKMGWTSKRFDNFVPYAKGIDFDGEGELKTVYKGIHEQGDYNKWISAVKKIRQTDNVCSRILLAASFASVLLPITKSLPFFVHVMGKTGTAKTVMLSACASVWGDPKQYLISFDSTQVGKDEMAAMLNNMPLCMDELQIIKGSKYDSKDNIIYKLTEGVGRVRGSKSGGIQAVKRWQNIMITTGEQSIISSGSGGGAINRVIELSTFGKTLVNDPVKAYRAITENYGFAGKKFIELLINNSEVINHIKDAQERFIEELRNKDITDKQCSSAGLILAVDDVLSDFIFDDGRPLQVNEILPYLVNDEMLNRDKQAYRLICEWIASNKLRFASTNDHIEKWGEIRGNKCFIASGIFEKFMDSIGYDVKSFLEWADIENKLEKDTDRKRKRKKSRINGIQVWGVMLVVDLLPDGTSETDEVMPF